MRRILQLAVVGLVALSATLVSAQITLSSDELMLGREVQVQVMEKGAPAAAVFVKAAYFPASEVEKEVVVGSTDARGAVAWTPAHAGLVTLSTTQAKSTVSVRYPSAPLSGLVVFAVAGLILFGGIALGASRIVKARSGQPS